MIKTAIRMQELQRRIYAKAKADKQHRFWGLYVHLHKPEILREAYRLARENDGAPGIDGLTFEDIDKQGTEKFIEEIQEALMNGTYKPSPNREVEIPKGAGKTRTLKIGTIRDRVVQGVLKLILEPIFETDFQDGSYGYRPKRSQHQALQRVEQAMVKSQTRVIDVDLKAYFDSVRHHILLAKIAKRIADDQIMRLLKQILKASGKVGVPQGGPISTLMSNIYLNEVDKMLEKAKEYSRSGEYIHMEYARWADDLVILVNHRSKYNMFYLMINKRLREELAKIDVQINEEKTKEVDLAKGESFVFLGYQLRMVKTLKGRQKPHLQPGMKTRKKLMASLREVFRKHQSQPLSRIIEQINPIVRGWVAYYRYGQAAKVFKYVQNWVLKKVRRHLMRAKGRQGFGWKRWSTSLLIKIHEIYDDFKLYRWKARPTG